MKEKAVVSWSGGKDGALALHDVQNDFDIVGLLTTVTEGYDRISVHGVRTSLLDLQARSFNYELRKVIISKFEFRRFRGASPAFRRVSFMPAAEGSVRIW